jgi:CDP-diacylglycerol--serine O-phosphatidyltransferase
MDLSRAKYILPNLFTLSNACAGFFSIHLATTADSARDVSLAAWLLVVAMVFDLFDGRVARLTRTESELGMQLDSLADALSFGVAPAVLLYTWGLSSLGTLGLFLSFVYVACALLRLARFNVMSADSEGPKSYFLGLATPLAAGTIVASIIAHVSLTDKMTTGATGSVAAMALLLGGLMVSNVRYRTFKDVDFRGRAGLGLVGLVALAVALAVATEPGVAFVVLLFAYILIGLGGGIVSLGRNLRDDRDDSSFEAQASGVEEDRGHSR